MLSSQLSVPYFHYQENTVEWDLPFQRKFVRKNMKIVEKSPTKFNFKITAFQPQK